VSALASFGARVPELTGRVVVLLKRALYDNDDEVSTTRDSSAGV
jgi:putative lipoic acid-binding regulatory protein